MPYVGREANSFTTVVDVTVSDDLTVTDDATIGGTALVTGVLTTTAATVFNGGFASNADSTMGTNKKLIFRDSAIHISSTADGDLSIAADDEIDITSTLIDINGAVDMSSTLATASTITVTTGASTKAGSFVGNGIEVKHPTGASNVSIGTQTGNDVKIAAVGAHSMRLDTNGVERLTIESGGDIDVGTGDIYFSTAGKGIVLGATSNTAANTLDDYEEGTWTPNFDDLSNTPNYHGLTGNYTKIGRKCTVQFFCQTANSPKPTFNTTSQDASFKVTGLPFALVSSGYTGSQGSVNAQSFFYHGTNNTQGVVGSGSTGGCYLTSSVNASEQMEFQVTNSGGIRGVVNNTGAAQGFIVEATCTYFTSD